MQKEEKHRFIAPATLHMNVDVGVLRAKGLAQRDILVRPAHQLSPHRQKSRFVPVGAGKGTA